ncbi:MAG: 16S rRNA (uracil(1498)-N(3))-methyltransferase [Flavobacterium sp.]|nr:16S rRNA (uracil(1498)-N(3))-methyltransferase [Flavobacterium sp.]
MQLFYTPEITEETKSFTFDREESKHIIKVLRKIAGDKLLVTNGLGFTFETVITLGSDTKCTVDIIKAIPSDPPKYNLHLAVAPTKMNDRYEWFLEKATEFGIHEITPLICDRSERKIIKLDRYEKILQSAMKQSLQSYLPKLNVPVPFSAFVKENNHGLRLIAHCEESDKTSLKEVLPTDQKIIILIGPEGDFSEKEIRTALENNYIPVSLGNTRLRTETAAIAACHTVALLHE